MPATTISREPQAPSVDSAAGDAELGAGVDTDVVALREPAVGEGDPARTALTPPGGAELRHRERLAGVEPVEQRIDVRQGVHETEGLSELTAGPEALEVPGDV